MANTHSADFEASSSQRFSRADTASLSITGDICIELWAKPESFPGGDIMYFLSKFDNSGQYSYALYLNDVDTSNVKIVLLLTDDGSTVKTYTSSSLGTNTSLTGAWNHYAVSWDASAHTASFFLNGIAKGTDSTPTNTAIFDGTDVLIVGASGNGGSPNKFFDGKIDDLRIWSSERTQAQILANLGAEQSTDSNLKGYWKFNESSGNATDSSGNSNTLTNVNTVTYSTDTAFFNGVETVAVASTDLVTISTGYSLPLAEAIALTDRAAVGNFSNTAKHTSTWSNLDKTN